MSRMPEPDIIDGEGVEVVRYEPPTPATLFGTSEPAAVIERATENARALADVIKAQKLYTVIGSGDRARRFVRVEGWTLLGTILGVFPVVDWTRPIEGGWEARVEARTLAGQIVGAAEAMCLNTERNWKDSDDYAIRSMAQTRATSKALRGPLGFIMQLAGYEPVPAEETEDPKNDPNPSAAGNDTKPPTEPQKRKLFALVGELDKKGLSPKTYKFKDPDVDYNGATTFDEWTKSTAADRFGVDSRAHMTRGQFAWMIDQLEGDVPV